MKWILLDRPQMNELSNIIYWYYVSVCPFKKCRIIFSIPAVSMATHNLIMCTLSIVCDGKGQQRFQLNGLDAHHVSCVCLSSQSPCKICNWHIKCKRQVKASAACWAKIKKKVLDSAHVNDRTYLLWVQSLIEILANLIILQQLLAYGRTFSCNPLNMCLTITCQ
jgi:hypothetical protein